MSNRLFEAIVDAGSGSGAFARTEHQDSLPVAILTCADDRLTPLVPELLRLPAGECFWLRAPGNIITDPLSPIARGLVLTTVLRPVKEIAIIGHTDCLVRKTSVLELTDRFKALGLDRSRLPDNLVEFFGLFASETQNVRRSVEALTASPILAASIPVHGLLLHLDSRRLEWVVNGYQAQASRSLGADTVTTSPTAAAEPQPPHETPPPATIQEKEAATEQPIPNPPTELQPLLDLVEALDKKGLFKILGTDRKVYGPVSREKLRRWLEEGRIDLATLAQAAGDTKWKPLAELVKKIHPPSLPPSLSSLEQLWKRKRR